MPYCALCASRLVHRIAKVSGFANGPSSAFLPEGNTAAPVEVSREAHLADRQPAFGACTTFALSVASFLFASCRSQGPEAGTQVDLAKAKEKASNAKREQMIAIMRARDTTVVFHGRVVDLDGRGVEGAAVTLHVRHFDPRTPFLMSVTKLARLTDDQGGFGIDGISGHSLLIEEIEKAGYEQDWSAPQDRGFNFARGHPAMHMPDPAKPVEFRFRRKGEPAFLVKKQFHWKIEPIGGTVVFILEQGLIRKWPDDRAVDSSVSRILFSAMPRPDWKSAEITLRAASSEDGMVLDDRVFYLAPEDGYSCTVSFEVEPQPQDPRWRRASVKKNVYFRRAGGRSFSRVELEVTVAVVQDKGTVQVVGTSYTNPDGSRNLEYDGKFNFEEGTRRRSGSGSSSSHR